MSTAANSTKAPPATAVDREPFSFDGDRLGVLCVHGFTGSPFEMRLLGESIAARGRTVRGPRLAGHEPDGRSLKASTWHDWYATVERAFDELRARCDRVALCGLSLGGLLCLELARHRGAQVSAVAAMASPVFLPPAHERFIRFTQRTPLLRDLAFPKLAGSDCRDPVMRKRNPVIAGGLPFRPLMSLVELGAHVRAHLGEIDRPLFLAHGRNDHVVPFACADVIAAGVAGPVERLDLERSFHLLTLDVERELLFRRVGDFLDAHLVS